MNAIEIQNVSYTYSRGTPFEKLALDDVSVSFKSGIITGLMGIAFMSFLGIKI